MLSKCVHFIIIFFLLCTGILRAESDPHAHHRIATSKTEPVAGKADVAVPDVLVLNQNAKKLDFKKDVIGNNIVVVNFAYTTCTTVCPVTSSIFSMLQKRLTNEIDKEVKLVTVTVDPARDTPLKLLKYSGKFSNGKGWSWITGDVKTIEKVLDAFGAYTPNFEDHPAMTMVGDAGSSEWYRYYGFAAPENLEARVRELINKRNKS